MSKYRDLSLEELVIFEEEFIAFLVVNGVVADDWEKIKSDEPEKANELISLFSKLVFEKVLQNTRFLEKIEPANIQAIQCFPEKMIMIAVHRKSENIDLSQIALSKINFNEIELIKGEKDYSGMREQELFEMICAGYHISDGTLFKSLILATV